MDKFLHFDFETRSMLDLREVGLHNYARHPSTEPWCAALAPGDTPVEIYDHATLFSPWAAAALKQYLDVGYVVVAHNAPFELEIWNEIMVPRAGWPKLDPARTICTMAAAYAMGLPGALEDAAMALGLPVQKDMEGRALVLRMARPRAVVEGKPVWWDDPERIARGHAYCRTDVEVARELHKRVMPLGERERKIWRMDYAINRRGIQLDAASARASVSLADRAAQDCDERLNILTGGEVQTVNALISLKQWLARQDPAHNYSELDKEHVTDLLELQLPDMARSALLLRQESGKASTAKLGPMLAVAGSDDRMRGLLQYHGATTGRWAGRKIQPHNFPRDTHSEDEAEQILKWIREGDDAAIELVYGERSLTAISRCLKAFMVPASGMVFSVGDFASIEGRGTAWISGEEWKLEAFRSADAGGPGVYELSYAKSFGVPVQSVKNPSAERQIGKVSELSLGYHGGVGAFKRMGNTYGVKVVTKPGQLKLAKGQFEITVDKVEEVKEGWRVAHPNIVRMWAALEGAAVAAVQSPGKIFAARSVKFKKAGSFLWCLLPSGRALCYPYPKIMPGKFGGPMLTYMAVPSPDDRKLGRIIADPRNAPRWARLSTYGGSLMENVVQAICRDILADKMLAMHEAGWKIVLHVHDEIVNEEAADRSTEMDAIMCAPLPWCPGFPIYAECGALRRYGKP